MYAKRTTGAGLEEIARERPSLIVLDLMMPEMDGFEFVDELHRNEEWKKLPVVVVTAKELTEEERERLNGYVDRVLQKGSYQKKELIDQVSLMVTARLQEKSRECYQARCRIEVSSTRLRRIGLAFILLAAAAFSTSSGMCRASIP